LKRVSYDLATRFPRASGQCRYCKKPLENKRLSWCEGASHKGGCFDKAQMEGNWSVIRSKAWELSKGFCALCKFDIAKMERELWEYHRRSSYDMALTMKFAKILYGVRSRNFPKVCWAADHIVPIVEGGDSFPTLDGVRILCLLCHDAVTRELRKRMSERRKRHRWMPLYRKDVL
jgi:hypothetical protein